MMAIIGLLDLVSSTKKQRKRWGTCWISLKRAFWISLLLGIFFVVVDGLVSESSKSLCCKLQWYSFLLLHVILKYQLWLGGFFLGALRKMLLFLAGKVDDTNLTHLVCHALLVDHRRMLGECHFGSNHEDSWGLLKKKALQGLGQFV